MNLILTVFLLLQASAGAVQLKPTMAQWYSDIAGTYTGTLFSAGYDIPVETTFFFEDGVLLGEYVMDEDSTLSRGDLSSILFGEEYLLTCTWTDIYGSGPVSFVFTDNCTGFAGFWSSGNDSSSYNWWGEKEETEFQQPVRD